MLSITVPYCNLRKIYESGQVCTWSRFRSLDGYRYIIPIADRYCVAHQNNDNLFFYTTNDLFFDWMFEYLDLAVDYRIINIRFRRLFPFTMKVGKRSKGVHVLRQPRWHALLNVVLSRGASPSATVGRYRRLATVCGTWKRMGSGYGTTVSFPAVPTAYDITGVGPDALRAVLGEDIADPLLLLAEDYLDGWYDFSEDELSYRQARNSLREFGCWSNHEVEKVLQTAYHYSLSYPSNGWCNAVIRRLAHTDPYMWVNKTLHQFSGYEYAISMFMQYAYVTHMTRGEGEEEWA